MSRKHWLLLTAALVAIVVVVSSIVQAIRSGSWGPVVSVCWVPAAVIAVWPSVYHRCPAGGGRVRRADLRR